MARLILAEVLKKKRVSKQELGRRLGLRPEHVYRLFRPGVNPKLSTLSAWAAALGCKVRDLIAEDPRPK